MMELRGMPYDPRALSNAYQASTTQCEAPQRERGIYRPMQDISQNISLIQNSLEKLIARLQPILQMPKSGLEGVDRKEVPEPVRASHVDSLHRYANDLNKIGQIIIYLEDNVEI